MGAVTSKMVQEMIQLREQGARNCDIARRMGISDSTVSVYLKHGGYRQREIGDRDTDLVPGERWVVKGYEKPKRDKPHYEVLIFNLVDQPKFEATRRFVYYPNLTDMLDFCHENGCSRAIDFEDRDDCFKEKYVYGSIFSSGHAVIGEYLISRLGPEPVHPQETFR